MKKMVTIITDEKNYEFEFTEMHAFSSHIIRLDDAKCSLWDRVELFNKGIIAVFNNKGSLYIDIDNAKHICFASEE